jgi:hypothetical protein
LNIQIKENDKNWEFEDEYIVIAVDSTDIKITNRGLGGCKINGMYETTTKKHI